MNKTCATCLHSTVPADKMGAMGWLRCDQETDYKNQSYRSPVAPCRFNPMRWQAKAVKVRA